MEEARASHRLAVNLLAGISLFLAASAMAPDSTGAGPVPSRGATGAGVVVPPAAVELPPSPGPAPAVEAPVDVLPAPVVLPTAPGQWFQPGGRNAGTEAPARFLAAVALHENAPLYVSDSWGRTTGGGQSDHHISRSDSWAVDLAVRGIQVPTPATELAARRVAAALGVPDWAGGNLTRTVDGYRFQVLWRVAGHFNHVHVGVRRV